MQLNIEHQHPEKDALLIYKLTVSKFQIIFVQRLFGYIKLLGYYKTQLQI